MSKHPKPTYDDVLRSLYGYDHERKQLLAELQDLRSPLWRLKHRPSNWSVAHELAKQNLLPATLYANPNHSLWRLANCWGLTVLHVATSCGRIPAAMQTNPDHPLWRLATTDGWAVAHEAVHLDALPPALYDNSDHPLWRLATKTGWSVAHEAAEYNNLPAALNDNPDHPLWSLTDAFHRTVRQIAERGAHE